MELKPYKISAGDKIYNFHEALQICSNSFLIFRISDETYVESITCKL
jgi:hypothetical protein